MRVDHRPARRLVDREDNSSNNNNNDNNNDNTQRRNSPTELVCCIWFLFYTAMTVAGVSVIMMWKGPYYAKFLIVRQTQLGHPFVLISRGEPLVVYMTLVECIKLIVLFLVCVAKNIYSCAYSEFPSSSAGVTRASPAVQAVTTRVPRTIGERAVAFFHRFMAGDLNSAITIGVSSYELIHISVTAEDGYLLSTMFLVALLIYLVESGRAATTTDSRGVGMVTRGALQYTGLLYVIMFFLFLTFMLAISATSSSNGSVSIFQSLSFIPLLAMMGLYIGYDHVDDDSDSGTPLRDWRGLILDIGSFLVNFYTYLVVYTL
jgi:hypothetical protein